MRAWGGIGGTESEPSSGAGLGHKADGRRSTARATQDAQDSAGVQAGACARGSRDEPPARGSRVRVACLVPRGSGRGGGRGSRNDVALDEMQGDTEGEAGHHSPAAQPLRGREGQR